MPGEHSPAWFHTRVLPVWSRIPAPAKSFSLSKSYTALVRSGMQIA